MTIANAVSRFLICPAVVAIGDWLFAGVSYAGWVQWLLTGFVLAAASILMDTTLLDRLGHVGAFLADTIAATLIVWASQFLLPATIVTWAGALGTGALLGVSEIVMHAWVQSSRRQGVRQNRP
ncbi:MAG TPA: DUF2512 family protein [Symbiobacteriaceae bacterium]|nr:DUF2512 family protein [Symbiobacteriaceae bacterium]